MADPYYKPATVVHDIYFCALLSVLQDLCTLFTVTAKNGKKLPAVEVISKLLIFFKNEFFEEYESFQKKVDKNLPNISRIMWIITVPAIWSLAAKKIMKNAAAMVRALVVYNVHLLCTNIRKS